MEFVWPVCTPASSNTAAGPATLGPAQTLLCSPSRFSAPARQLSWFYFESPSETWEYLCGRAGWMTVCNRCQRQVDFFLEVPCFAACSASRLPVFTEVD